jgi:hypothetical protein
MRILETCISSMLPKRPVRPVWLANESATQSGKTSITLFLPNQLSPVEPGKDHWVQLSPFGDFGNRTGNTRVIQRFRKEDADQICNSFNGAARKVLQPFGMPFYIGHPDHAAFSGKPGHTDTRSYGRGKEMVVRHDAACAGCKAFANAQGNDAAPCPEHGLFVKMHWNPDGEHLLSNESFHGHSVNWAAMPDGMEGGVQVYRPIKVKSAGFTNEPNIPVRPASLANAEASDGEVQEGKAIVPPGLKEIAGFKPDEDVTMEQIIEALKNAKKDIADGAGTSTHANAADDSSITDDFFAWLKTAIAGGYDKLPDSLRYPIDSLLEAHRNAKDAGAIAAGNVALLDPRAAALALVLLGNDAADGDDAEKKSFVDQVHGILGTDPATGKAGAISALQDKVKKAGLVEKVKAAGSAAKAAMDKHFKARQDLETHLANERKAHATLLVDGLVRAGKVVTKDREAAITQLVNAGDKFGEVATQLGNGATVVKTVPKSKDLANQHASATRSETERRAKFQQLMDERQKQFPNEAYDARFAAVADSAEGRQLFAQMTVPQE